MYNTYSGVKIWSFDSSDEVDYVAELKLICTCLDFFGVALEMFSMFDVE